MNEKDFFVNCRNIEEAAARFFQSIDGQRKSIRSYQGFEVSNKHAIFMGNAPGLAEAEAPARESLGIIKEALALFLESLDEYERETEDLPRYISGGFDIDDIKDNAERFFKSSATGFPDMNYSADLVEKISVEIWGFLDFLKGSKYRAFAQCRNIEEAQARFHQLMKQYRPGAYAGEGGAEITKEVILQFRAFLADFFLERHQEWSADNGKAPVYSDMTAFADTVLKVIHLDISIKINGFWIYCSGDTRPVKEYLKSLGFWFSGKRQAWVYSGGEKRYFRPRRRTGSAA